MSATSLEPQVARFKVEEGASARLDRYLAQRLGFSRSRVVSLIVDGRVRVESRPGKKS